MTTRINCTQEGNVFIIGLNRPEKRNAADFTLLQQLAEAYGEFERNPELRVGLVHAVGEHFTGGLDLSDLGSRLEKGTIDFVGEEGIHPWQIESQQLSKPVVIAVQGTCLTLGIELILASDIAVAAESTQFAQLEVSRGILPFGGATLRFPRAVGWGNAMRWMLTGDYFNATDAHRMGLVQEVVSDGEQYHRALEIAQRIAAQAPLAVQALLHNARTAIRKGEEAAEEDLPVALARLTQSEDARIGMEAFASRKSANFVGR